MKKIAYYSLFIIAAALLSGCATSSGPQAEAEEAAQREQLVSSPMADVLDLWQDKSFKKRFAESYIARTEVEPGVTTVERDEMQSILDLISEDRMDDAIRKLERGTKEASSAVFDFTLANLYFQQEKLDEAAQHYQKAVEKYPKFLRAHKNLGLIYVRGGEFDKAAEHLSRAIELGETDALTYGLLGFAYSSLGDFVSAESAYRQAILMDPETLDWKMGLARSFFKGQRFADAVSLCSSLLEQNPERADLWQLQANAYLGMEQLMKAAENYELADRLGGSTLASLNALGDIYVSEELFPLAASAYLRAIDLDPKQNPDRSVRAAKVLVSRSAFDEAKQVISRIQDSFGSSLETEQKKDLLKLQARIAVAEGAGDQEAAVLEEIVEIDPLDGEALILLGQHHSREGHYEKAALYFEQAANIEGHEADASVRHAQMLVSQSRYVEAVPLLKRAQELKPREDVARYLEQVERVAKSR